MQFKFLLIKNFLRLLFAACCLSVPTWAATVALAPASNSVTIAETFDVSLSISGLTNTVGDSLGGFDVDLQFDPVALQLTGFTFIDTASNSNQLALPEPGSLPFFGDVTTASGIIDAFAVSGNSAFFLDLNQLGAFDFLKLTFRALSVTTLTTISLDVTDPGLVFLNSGSGDLTVSFGNTAAAVTVTEADNGNAVPIPSSLALMLLGLATVLLTHCSQARFHAISNLT